MSKYSLLDELLVTSGNIELPLEERQEAFSQFYEETEGFVQKEVKMRISDFHQAENLVQETYMRLWEKAGLYKGNGKLFPYLRRVIRNLSIDYIRWHGRRWDMRNLESILEWENRLNEKGEICDGGVG